MPGPLHGYTVLELATMVSGPLATQLLADQGADVIKIEAPGDGDLMRRLGPTRGGMTAIFTTVNRNKRSLALDLKTPDGFHVLEHLVEGADVLVQNFRPGVAERMGLGYDAMRTLRPDLVYLSISGFGERGPYAQKRVYDPIIQALSGLAAIQADRDTGRPRMMRTIVPDKITAMTAAQAVTAALLERERSGKGQHVRLAMLDATVSFAWPEGMVTHTFVGDGVADPAPGSTADLVYETADGYLTASTMSDAEWRGMARATGHPEWLDDPRFATPGGRVANSDARLRMVGEVLRRHTTAHWLAALEAEDVPCAPILTRDQVVADPQVKENALLVEEEHPAAGRIRWARAAARFDRTPPAPPRPAPELGQHNAEILGEIGYSDAEIHALAGAGAFGSPPPASLVARRHAAATGDRGNGSPRAPSSPGEPREPRLYTELASWWPLLSAPDDYEEEAAFYLATMVEACARPPRTLLELGSGGGNNASHLKARFDRVVLVDRSPGMLRVSRALNRECHHVAGDMRTVRLGRRFDCVFVHDAVCYLTSEAELRQAIETAFLHCAPGGAALFAPDHVRESFRPSTDHGGHDGTDRALRYLEWTWDPDPDDSSYLVDYVYLLRSTDGTVRVERDRHREGLFARGDWLRWLAEAGFEPRSIPLEHSELEPGAHEVFVARKP